MNGTANIPSGTPLFPNVFSASYFQNAGFIYDGLLSMIVVMAVLFFLVPSLTKHS